MAQILVKNTKAIVTIDDNDYLIYNADILIKDNVIEKIGKSIYS